MACKQSVLHLRVTKTGGLALLSALILTLTSLTSTSLGQEVPSGRLAYSVSGFDENLGRFDWNLYTTTLGTKDFEAVPLNHKGMYPSWGPNGELLYFVQFDAGQADIYSINPNKPKNKTRITSISGTYRFLSVSPNGKKLAFNGYTMEQLPEDNQVWILDIASGDMEVMTEVPHFGWPYSFWGISWAPNGKRIAFSLSRPGWLEQLYLLDVETKETEILTESNKDYYPVWAPDGQRISFFRWNREFDTLCTIDVETKQIEPLINVDKATGYWGNWASDGDFIAYSRWSSVYLYELASGDTEELFEVDGSIFVISWLSEEPFPVAPREKLVTTWSTLKRSTAQQ